MKKALTDQKCASREEQKVLTPREVEDLIIRVRVGLNRDRTQRRREEPGLTEEARQFFVRF